MCNHAVGHCSLSILKGSWSWQEGLNCTFKYFWAVPLMVSKGRVWLNIILDCDQQPRASGSICPC